MGEQNGIEAPVASPLRVQGSGGSKKTIEVSFKPSFSVIVHQSLTYFFFFNNKFQHPLY